MKLPKEIDSIYMVFHKNENREKCEEEIKKALAEIEEKTTILWNSGHNPSSEDVVGLLVSYFAAYSFILIVSGLTSFDLRLTYILTDSLEDEISSNAIIVESVQSLVAILNENYPSYIKRTECGSIRLPKL